MPLLTQVHKTAQYVYVCHLVQVSLASYSELVEMVDASTSAEVVRSTNSAASQAERQMRRQYPREKLEVLTYYYQTAKQNKYQTCNNGFQDPGRKQGEQSELAVKGGQT